MLRTVQGQDEAVHFLHRVVEGKLTIPLLLLGPEGTGRRLAATQTARAVFCQGTKEPACPCFHCKQVAEGVHPDFIYITAPEGKELGVEPIREVVEQAGSFPSIAPLRFFVIDGVDHMTTPAANAVLKTLEEPPPTVRFLLLAENSAGVIPTIRSRCGLVRFCRLPEALLVSKLEPFEADVAKRLVYARMAEGSVGQAIRFWGAGRLALRDRVWTLLTTGFAGDLSSLFAAVDELEKDLDLALRLLDQLVHDLLMAPYAPTRMMHQDIAENLHAVRAKVGEEKLLRLRAELRVLGARHASTYINVPFHLKAALASACVGV